MSYHGVYRYHIKEQNFSLGYWLSIGQSYDTLASAKVALDWLNREAKRDGRVRRYAIFNRGKQVKV
jgi:hypothetical protein